MQAEEKHVNLIGFSIFHQHWEGDIDELKRLLALCGIKVNAVLCAGCTVKELKSVTRAKVNLLIQDEFADELAFFLKSRFNMPILTPALGAPVGFKGTSHWIKTVCNVLDTDP